MESVVIMYKDLNTYYKERFGHKVYKLSLDGGMTCPNRDGTCGVGGCIFCSENGSGEFAAPFCEDIAIQLENAKKRVEHKNPTGKYMPYFQSFSGTYAKIEHLRKIYYEAIKPDFTVGLSIATRPDCLPDEVIELLAEVNKIKPVFIELGLQTVHDSTAQYINRGYETKLYFEAVEKLKKIGVNVVTHIIIGLPNETEEMILDTVRQIASLTDGIKFHLLYVVKDTLLEEEFKKGNLKEYTLEEYAKLLKKCIKLLPENLVVHRLTGDGDKKTLVSPLWTADKKRVLNYLRKYLAE